MSTRKGRNPDLDATNRTPSGSGQGAGSGATRQSSGNTPPTPTCSAISENPGSSPLAPTSQLGRSPSLSCEPECQPPPATPQNAPTRSSSMDPFMPAPGQGMTLRRPGARMQQVQFQSPLQRPAVTVNNTVIPAFQSMADGPATAPGLVMRHPYGKLQQGTPKEMLAKMKTKRDKAAWFTAALTAIRTISHVRDKFALEVDDLIQQDEELQAAIREQVAKDEIRDFQKIASKAKNNRVRYMEARKRFLEGTDKVRTNKASIFPPGDKHDRKFDPWVSAEFFDGYIIQYLGNSTAMIDALWNARMASNLRHLSPLGMMRKISFSSLLRLARIKGSYHSQPSPLPKDVIRLYEDPSILLDTIGLPNDPRIPVAAKTHHLMQRNGVWWLNGGEPPNAYNLVKSEGWPFGKVERISWAEQKVIEGKNPTAPAKTKDRKKDEGKGKGKTQEKQQAPAKTQDRKKDEGEDKGKPQEKQQAPAKTTDRKKDEGEDKGKTQEKQQAPAKTTDRKKDEGEDKGKPQEKQQDEGKGKEGQGEAIYNNNERGGQLVQPQPCTSISAPNLSPPLPAFPTTPKPGWTDSEAQKKWQQTVAEGMAERRLAIEKLDQAVQDRAVYVKQLIGRKRSRSIPTDIRTPTDGVSPIAKRVQMTVNEKALDDTKVAVINHGALQNATPVIQEVPFDEKNPITDPNPVQQFAWDLIVKWCKAVSSNIGRADVNAEEAAKISMFGVDKIATAFQELSERFTVQPPAIVSLQCWAVLARVYSMERADMETDHSTMRQVRESLHLFHWHHRGDGYRLRGGSINSGGGCYIDVQTLQCLLISSIPGMNGWLNTDTVLAGIAAGRKHVLEDGFWVVSPDQFENFISSRTVPSSWPCDEKVRTFIPVFTKNHWWLMYLDPFAEVVYGMDSLYPRTSRTLEVRRVLKLLGKLHPGANWAFKNVRCTQQKNHYDCGMFVIYNVRHIMDHGVNNLDDLEVTLAHRIALVQDISAAINREEAVPVDWNRRLVKVKAELPPISTGQFIVDFEESIVIE
ncbi:hypothetical protein AYL99_11860 [Fonsecaea erecta]|uniref:Ubiquitin-like protease family profile domain-containing protein n=1 Tax=Fonsecaea erecta TaxID=1367422 RepID=A0A178Z2I7_9EURO|nr:hypothetical protein AYL99_11860 [Fonsecaea erecta]OAP53980.1 hypothetical protein AYL99_11860 [Fonsecaea erecta]